MKMLQNSTKVNWAEMYYSHNVNVAYEMFLKLFLSNMNEACPTKKIKYRKKQHRPWMTKGLINACRKNNNLYLSLIKHRTQSADFKYNKHKKKLTSILQICEINYYSNKLKEYKNDMKKYGTY